jgi:hypothetical protein
MTTNRVQDSHYISRFLLRNWERSPGKLNYFDFVTGLIKSSSAKAMYVADAPFPARVEEWLGKTIETPMGEYLADAKKTLAAAALSAPEPTPRAWRAIALALLAQGSRTKLAQDERDTGLAELASKDDKYLDDLVQACHEQNEIIIGWSAMEHLYFPSAGIVPFPLPGSMRAWLVPMTPCLFAGLVSRDVAPGTVGSMLRSHGAASTLSVGLKGDRVVVPPLADRADLSLIARHTRDSRTRATRLCRLTSKANALLDGARRTHEA